VHVNGQDLITNWAQVRSYLTLTLTLLPHIHSPNLAILSLPYPVLLVNQMRNMCAASFGPPLALLDTHAEGAHRNKHNRRTGELRKRSSLAGVGFLDQLHKRYRKKYAGDPPVVTYATAPRQVRRGRQAGPF